MPLDYEERQETEVERTIRQMMDEDTNEVIMFLLEIVVKAPHQFKTLHGNEYTLADPQLPSEAVARNVISRIRQKFLRRDKE